MPIRFTCPHCKKGFAVKDYLAGKKAACPACKKTITIPGPSAETVLTREKEAEDIAVATFGEAHEPVKKEEPKFVEFNCPHCDEPVKVSADLEGKQAPCPSCRRIVKVPLLKKKDPKDWRKVDTSRPTGARADNEPAPEGAWGSSTMTRVSQQALLEGTPTKRKPLTRSQKLTRAGIAAGTFLGLGLIAWAGISFWGKRTEEQAFARAQEILASPDKADLTAEAKAALTTAAAVYRFRQATTDSGKKASDSLQAARQFLDKKDPGIADYLLIEQALALIEMGDASKSEDVRQGRRLPWDGKADNVFRQLEQTLERVHPEARDEALRKVIRALLARGQGPLALTLARQVAVPPPTSDPKAGPVSASVPEAQAAAGLEFYRGGDMAAATNLAKQALSYYPAAKEKDAARHPDISPALVALCMALDIPGPPVAENADKSLPLRIGQAAGAALKKNQPQVRAIIDTIEFPPEKWQAWAGVALIARDDETVLGESIRLVEESLRDKQLSPRVLARLVERGAEGNYSGDRLRILADMIGDSGLKDRAQLALFRMSLAGQKETARTSALDSLPEKSLARFQAALDLSRHNARHDTGFMKEVEGWSDPAQQAFGYMGVALGMQEKKSKK